MKIGFFDSGTGGLVIARSVMQALPQYNYVYLGDTAHLPYGDRPQSEIYKFTHAAVKFLFEQDCQLVVIACNTASAKALRRLQQEYLPTHFPDRRILGVLIPAAEAATIATRNNRIGVLATTKTIASQTFVQEITKLRPNAYIIQQAAPSLVPLIESNQLAATVPILQEAITTFIQHNIDTLILGCTHYPLLKEQLQAVLKDETIQVISQNDIIASKLQNYLTRHLEITSHLSKHHTRQFFVTDMSYLTHIPQLFDSKIKFEKISL